MLRIFIPLLTVLFIGLKLTGYITWSWWWVLSPFWIPVAFMLSVIVLLYLVYVACDIGIKVIEWKDKQEAKQ